MLVDFHTHLFPPEVLASRERLLEREVGFGLLYADPRHRFPTVEEMLADMDAAGVDRAVVLGFGWSDPGRCIAHNDFLSDLVRRFPDRLSAFGAVQPRDAAAAVSELSRFARLGLRGVGELMPHLQGYSLADDRILGPIAEAATALGLIVLTHASEPVGHEYPGKGNVYPQDILALAERHPDLVLVAAHWGGGLPFYALMPEVARATRNVYYDSAASSLLYRPEVFPLAAAAVGAERVLFGSDYPLLRLRPFLRKVRASGLAEPELGRVLGGNAARLLGLEGVAQPPLGR